MTSIASAPSLVVGNPRGPNVVHLMLQVTPGNSGPALAALSKLEVSFGVRAENQNCVSVGLSFTGLAALNLPERYQRVFLRLAPAFRDGAWQRSRRLGDDVGNWRRGFHPDYAHVLVSWHGDEPWLSTAVGAFLAKWPRSGVPDGFNRFDGHRLGAPAGQAGEWVHFGYRDGISEIVIAGMNSAALDQRPHATGELLLGHPNDIGSNRFALTRARDKARQFFHGGSFGAFRPMEQNVHAFDQQVTSWLAQLSKQLPGKGVTRDFVKAKLCGRWPDGRTIAPDDFKPAGNSFAFDAKLADDPDGYGCPFGAHSRRMNAPSLDNAQGLPRPLQRRSMPFGTAAWDVGAAANGEERGLLGHFFCASLETQFEHLLGQWASNVPLGFQSGGRARDPLIGPHEDSAAGLTVPLRNLPSQTLSGMQPWTVALGTMYAWYPAADAWQDILDQNYAPVEDEEPWV